MNYLFFWRCIVGLWMCQTGAGVRKNTIIFRRKNSCLIPVHVFVLARGRKKWTRRSIKLWGTCGAYCIPWYAFQTKLSTASRVNVQFICDRLCYWLYMTWYSLIIIIILAIRHCVAWASTLITQYPWIRKPQKQKEVSAQILLSSVHVSGFSFVYYLHSFLLPTYYDIYSK